LQTARWSVRSRDVLHETLVSFAQAARRLPPFRGDKPVNPATLYRWATSGVKLPDGSALKLEAVRLGGRFLTSAEALQRFVDRQTAAFSPAPAPAVRSPAQRTLASEAAEAALIAAGC
jgi:hypothetical protein